MTVHSRAIERFAQDDVARAYASVNLAPAVAYEKFRHDIARWWPREYTYSGYARKGSGATSPGSCGGCRLRR